MKRFAFVPAALLIALTIVSCGLKTSGKVKVAFVSNTVSPFWRIAKAGVNAGERDFNVECDFRMPAQGNATEQKQILEDLLVKGVTGIAISPINPANQTDILNQVAESANLITMDSDAPESKRICYVGTNNYQAGRTAGKEIKKALPNGGKVVLFVGTLDALNARERRQGIIDEVKGSKVQIIDTLTDNADHVKAKQNVENTIVKHPDVAGLMGLWSYNGPAIAEAVKAAGKIGKIKVVVFDEEDGTLQGIKDGVIFSTIVQNPYQFGYQSMRILAALARGEDPKIPKNKVIYLPERVINKTNVDAFWKELKKHLAEGEK
ncbi:MAG: sugar-binding protein [Armatimonadetes bacterium]|nr:sugar-binding protein [Armatimonadota bacterium]